jgi:pyruvate/2-oxoglutarate dehydrogenase complex dihydrolipoamide dehydrogenase (E3) component
LIVLGASAVGLEMAQLFARAGSDVTLVELEERIAPNEDEEVSALLRTYLEAEGIRADTGFRTERVKKTTIGVILHGTQKKRSVLIEAERLLVATGRRPNTEGLGLEQARASGREVRVTVLPMDQVPQALAARDMRGMVKLVADRDTDRLLGAHIVAPLAGEMIQVAVMALRFGLKVQNLRDTMFPYLTGVEAIKLAALTFKKDIAKLSCCAG